MAINYGISTDYINFSNTNSLTGLITSNLIYAFDAARSRSYSLGVTTSDLNGTAVVGTLTGGVVFDYLNLGSMQFDGVDDYIALQNGANTSNPISLPQTCTVYSWVKTNVNKDNGIFSHYSGGPVDLGFYINSAGKLSYAQYDGQWNYYSSTGNSVPIGTWTHVAFTRSSSSLGPLRMYINGQLNHTVTVVAPRFLGGGNMGSIGTMWYSGSRFNGNISMLLVYSTEHSQEQIAQQYNVHRKRYNL